MEAGSVIHPEGHKDEKPFDTPIENPHVELLPSLEIPKGMTVKASRRPAFKQVLLYFIVFYLLFTAAGLLYVTFAT
jgi:hypothetical protein